MTDQVAIIDSGGANIASVRYALSRLGRESVLTTDADTIRQADRVLLPGVGAAADAMRRLRQAGLVDVIRDLTMPVLGICLGMQLLAEASEEENVECLGIIDGTARKLAASPDNPVPNMGWCPLDGARDHPLLSNLGSGEYFYFLHSYALPVTGHTLATARHEDAFSAVVGHRNFFAAQFHPERSAKAGARLLKNFLELEL